MRVLQASTAILGMSDPDTTDNSHAANVRKAVRLTAQYATAICAHHRVRQGLAPVAPLAGLSHAADFLYMLTGERPNPAATKAFDASLTSTPSTSSTPPPSPRARSCRPSPTCTRRRPVAWAPSRGPCTAAPAKP